MEDILGSPGPGTAFYVYYFGMFSIIACINIPGNILIIIAVFKTPNLQKPCNFCIASLAVTDLLIGLVYPVYNISHLQHVPEISRPLGQWNVCRFLLCEVIALDICSSYHLVAITINRYIAIVNPLRYHVYVTTRSTKYVIVFIWVISQGVCVIMFTLYNPEEYILRQEPSCRFELIFSLAHMCVYFIFQLILPLILMIPMYARIANIARTQAKAIAILKRLPWHKDRACCCHINYHELKSTFLVSILLVSYTVAWVPFMTYSFYRIQCVKDCYFSPFIRASCRILLYLNSAINIFIYALRLKEFRKSIKHKLTHFFRMILCREKNGRAH